jgi:hypothetical protein
MRILIIVITGFVVFAAVTAQAGDIGEFYGEFYFKGRRGVSH